MLRELSPMERCWVHELSLKSIFLASAASRDHAVTPFPMFLLVTLACSTQILTVPLGTTAPPPKGLFKHIPGEPTLQPGARRQTGEGRDMRQSSQKSCKDRDLGKQRKWVSWGETIFARE